MILQQTHVWITRLRVMTNYCRSGFHSAKEGHEKVLKTRINTAWSAEWLICHFDLRIENFLNKKISGFKVRKYIIQKDCCNMGNDANKICLKMSLQ